MDKLKRILQYCSACIAFYIGAGFATMQEVMQYEASYGSRFWVVIAVCAIIYIYTNWSFISNGNRLQVKHNGDIYRAYCGKYIGRFFDYFSALFCYMSFVVMCGGANSTAMEQWGLPNGVGAVILAVLVILTAVFGLNKIVKALGIFGPIIVVLIIFVAVWTAISGLPNLAAGMAAVDSGKYDITQVGSGNPLASGASYGGFVILWFAAFLSKLGGNHDKQEVNIGMLLSTVAIFMAAAVCCIALIANIDALWNVGIPALVLAKSIHPLLATIFTVIIFLGIYTSACPLLWTGVHFVASDGTKRYKALIILGGVLACLIACYVPYRPLLNVIYGLNGYLGFVLVAFMIVNDLKIYTSKKMKNMSNPISNHKCIVFCADHYNPLGICRSLGEEGISPIVVMTSSHAPMISHCKYVKDIYYVANEQEGLSFIIEKFGNEVNKPFIFTGSDDTTRVLDMHYEELKDKFYFYNGGANGKITEFQNKKTISEAAFECGCNLPKTEVLKKGELPTSLQYPVITKAIISEGNWKADMHVCKDEEELLEAYKTIKSNPLLVEEFIVKKNELCVDGFSINGGGNVWMPYTSEYLRFTDLSYGNYMWIKPLLDDDVRNKIQKVLQKANFSGIFEAEFLIDDEGKLYFLEINFRNSTWSYAYTYGGLNLPYQWAKSTLAGSIDYKSANVRQKPFKAMAELNDFSTAVKTKQVSFVKWFFQFLFTDCHYVFNKKDPMPFLYIYIDKIKKKLC